MMFNKVDNDRLKSIGYNRSCVEWLLRNGACARLTSNSTILHCDYNAIPPESTKFFIKEIEAIDSGISGIGFPHLKGCVKLDRISLNNCTYIEDEALYQLEDCKASLKILEINGCKNITDDGVRSLAKLTNLQKLVLSNLPYVKDFKSLEKELKEALKECDITINK
ncbi:unnamed protein product [Diamesa serratosioi]